MMLDIELVAAGLTGGHVSAGDWLVLIALAVLVLVSLVRRLPPLRLGLCLFAVLIIGCVMVETGRPIIAFLAGMLIIVNLMRLATDTLGRDRVQFSAEEDRMRGRLFPDLAPAVARDLIDQGDWNNAQRTHVLAAPDQAVAMVHYLAEGSAATDGNPEATERWAGGEWVGDRSAGTGIGPAQSIRLITDARLWSISGPRFDRWLAANPDAAATLDRVRPAN